MKGEAMPFEPFNCIKLVCDGCGDTEPFTQEGMGYVVAEDREEAEQVVRDCEGTIDGDRILCMNCACKEDGHPPIKLLHGTSRYCLCGEKVYDEPTSTSPA
jgi:hypothetical protein